MSMQYQMGWKQILLSQAMIIVFAVVAGLYRQYYIYVILAYFAILPILISRQGRKRIGDTKVSLEDLEDARKLWEEKNAMDLVAKDTEYMEEISKQMKSTTYTMISFPVIIAYFYIYRYALSSYVRGLVENPSAGAFLDFLIMFEGSFLISQAFMLYFRRKAAKITPEFIMVPKSYTVTTKGIFSRSFGSSFAFTFPLKNVEINLNERRGFVELVFSQESKPQATKTKIRLYSRNPRRLYEILKRRMMEK